MVEQAFGASPAAAAGVGRRPRRAPAMGAVSRTRGPKRQSALRRAPSAIARSPPARLARASTRPRAPPSRSRCPSRRRHRRWRRPASRDRRRCGTAGLPQCSLSGRRRRCGRRHSRCARGSCTATGGRSTCPRRCGSTMGPKPCSRRRWRSGCSRGAPLGAPAARRPAARRGRPRAGGGQGGLGARGGRPRNRRRGSLSAQRCGCQTKSWRRAPKLDPNRSQNRNAQSHLRRSRQNCLVQPRHGGQTHKPHGRLRCRSLSTANPAAGTPTRTVGQQPIDPIL
mmetsp:Transcript_87781/g.247671  ORF Transcript_87781/g.247671 Transcript_87781/m.247671 type:complete len:282 (+) Transcript_87781:309-1154(+)